MAVVLTCYYRPKPGGLCTRLFRAIDALLAQGHTVHYLAVAPFPIEHHRCVFHRFPWPVRHSDTLLFWAVFHLLAPILLFFVALKHRVTHAFAFGSTYAFLLQPVRIFLGISVSCFLRGDTILSHQLRHRPRWIVLMDSWIEGVALIGMHLVGVSEPLLNAVLRRHPSIKLAQYSILPNHWTPAESRFCISIKPPLRLATVGILEPMKNQRFVIQVLSMLAEYPWCFNLYGIGPEERRLKNAVHQYGFDQKVSFMGWVNQETIWPRTDLMLSVSIHEGMPNAVLEAISHGIPVLASDIAAHRNLLPPSQLLPLDDLQGWRALLLSILRDPAVILPRMVQKQDAFADHLRFDWDERIVQMIIGSP